MSLVSFKARLGQDDPEPFSALAQPLRRPKKENIQLINTNARSRMTKNIEHLRKLQPIHIKTIGDKKGALTDKKSHGFQVILFISIILL